MEKEIHMTNFPNSGAKTLYFGGGTPSLLNADEWRTLLKNIRAKTDLSDLKEFTVECNPEDISNDFVVLLKELGANRISLGLQSLNSQELSAMNRAHDVEQSWQALNLLQKANIHTSIDLIYGTPWKSDSQWEKELMEISSFDNIVHLSAYALTVEPKTALAHQIKSGKTHPIDEQIAADQFEILQKHIHQIHWEAYEISNYCKPGFRALHNSSYWNFNPYFGIGPSAHSFDGIGKRYWNVSNNAVYCKSIESNLLPREYEELNDTDRLNEYIMVRLRTSEGINWDEIALLNDTWKERNQSQIEHYKQQCWITESENGFCFTSKGKLLGDELSANLFD